MSLISSKALDPPKESLGFFHDRNILAPTHLIIIKLMTFLIYTFGSLLMAYNKTELTCGTSGIGISLLF